MLFVSVVFWWFRSCLWYVWHEIDCQKSRSMLKMWAQIMWNWTEKMHRCALKLGTFSTFTNEKFSGRGQILLVIQTYVRFMPFEGVCTGSEKTSKLTDHLVRAATWTNRLATKFKETKLHVDNVKFEILYKSKVIFVKVSLLGFL